MRVVLFGYHDMGAVALEALLGQGDEVPLLVTHRDDPGEGRWFRTPAPLAVQAGSRVAYRDDLAPRDLAALVRDAAADLVLSAYYRRLIPMSVVRAAPLGGLNVHGSLLPRLRGCAPLNWALALGDQRTGVTLHHMVPDPDAGDVVAQRAVDIAPRETAPTLHRKLLEAARALLAEALPLVRSGRAPRVPQDHSLATYRGRRRPADGELLPGATVAEADRLVRAVAAPWPGAFVLHEGLKLLVWEARPGPASSDAPPGRLVRLPSGELGLALADGLLLLDLVQAPGGPVVSGRAFSLPTLSEVP